MKHQTPFSRRATTKKYPSRPAIATRDAAAYNQWQQATATEAPLGSRQFAAGWVQHPHTGLYQTWLSTNGLDVTCISAHRSMIQAEAGVRALKTLITSGGFYDDEKTATLIAQLKRESDEEPRALPDDLVRLICREILHTLVDQPQQTTPPARLAYCR